MLCVKPKRWLEWLDRGLDESPFTTGSGRPIEALPYVDPDTVSDDLDLSGLIEAVHLRLKTPLAEGLA